MGSRRVLALVVLVVLASARPADAGWLYFIWEMSGPQMIGIGGGCERSLRSGEWRCDVPLRRFPDVIRTRNQADDRWWVKAYSYYYFSTSENQYDAGKVQGFGVDPQLMVAYYPGAGKSVRVTHGAGVSYQRFWSEGFTDTVNAGSYKVEAVSAEFGTGAKLKVAVNLRYWWDGFTSPAPNMTRQEKSEGTIGFVASFTF
jgi:hypothetical protein